MKKSLSAFITICSWLLKNEKELVKRARAANTVCVRPSAILLILFTPFYIMAKVDILPELWIPGVVGILDDVALGLVATAYIFSELIYCSGVNIIKKKVNLPDYDVETELSKDDEDDGPGRMSSSPTEHKKSAILGGLISTWRKLQNIGGQEDREGDPDDQDLFE